MMMGFHDFSLLSWKIHGVVSKNARYHVRELAKRHKSFFFMLLEIHLLFHKVRNLQEKLGYFIIMVEEARCHYSGI